jgi:hypothetical protein
MLDKERATAMAQIIYDHGATELFFVGDPVDLWDDDYEETDFDENGFDPYAGCYTGDC